MLIALEECVESFPLVVENVFDPEAGAGLDSS